MAPPDPFERFADLALTQAGRACLPPYVADLATSFPLLFYMLASDAGDFARRAAALHLVGEGRPLAEVAAAYGLPLSLRRIPPEGCKGKFQWFDWSRGANAALSNHIPTDPVSAARWLSSIHHAAHVCDERFALWIARHSERAGSKQLDRMAVLGLAAYAWYSQHPDNPLQSVTTVPWTPRFSRKRALREANHWFTRVGMLASAGEYPLSDSWLEPGCVNGFEIVPILSFDALKAERKAMGTCLLRYRDRLSCGVCRLFAVRTSGTSVATVEVAPDADGHLAIVQLKGVHNKAASDIVHAAVHAWFASQPMSMKQRDVRLEVAKPARRRPMLIAYREAKGGLAPIKPDTFPPANQLNRHIQDCAERAERPEQTTLDPELCERVRAMLCVRLNRDWLTDGFADLHFHHIRQGILQVSTTAGARFLWREGRRDVLLSSAIAVWPSVVGLEIRTRHPTPAPQAERRRAALEASLQDTHRAAMVRSVLTSVAHHYKVSEADIVSQRRHRSVVLPRHVGIYLAVRHCQCSMDEAGYHFGRRDQTTAMLSVRKVEERIKDDPTFRDDVEALKSTLSATTGVQAR